jgi:site-specific recombinase XerD
MELPWMQQIGRPPERKRIPVVLTVQEVQTLLSHMAGTEALLAALLYGSGLRLREALGLRSRMSISTATRSLCAAARATRTAW